MLFGAVRLLAGVGAARARRMGRHARAQAVAVACLAFFALIALVFILAAVTVALAARMGLLAALVLMAVLALLGCLATFLVIRAREDRRRRQREMEALQDRRLMETAAITLLPQLRGAGMLGLGVLAAGAYLFSKRGGRGPEDD